MCFQPSLNRKKNFEKRERGNKDNFEFLWSFFSDDSSSFLIYFLYINLKEKETQKEEKEKINFFGS